MTQFSVLADGISPFVDAPQVVRERAMREAARALCSQAPVWQESLKMITTAGTLDYPAFSLQGGEPLVILAIDGLAGLTWQAHQPGMFRVSADPGQRPLTVTAQYQPASDSQALPDHIANARSGALRAYALHWIHQLPEQRDIGMADYYKAEFVREVAQARSEALNQFTPALANRVTSPLSFV